MPPPGTPHPIACNIAAAQIFCKMQEGKSCCRVAVGIIFETGHPFPAREDHAGDVDDTGPVPVLLAVPVMVQLFRRDGNERADDRIRLTSAGGGWTRLFRIAKQELRQNPLCDIIQRDRQRNLCDTGRMQRSRNRPARAFLCRGSGEIPRPSWQRTGCIRPVIRLRRQALR